MFYIYANQYGYAIALLTGKGTLADFKFAFNSPTFNTKREAQAHIDAYMEAGK